jgi:hypothetical protein
MRHLGPAQRQPLEERFEDIVVRPFRPFRALVRRERPDLAARDTGLVTTAILAACAPAGTRRMTG